MTTRRRKRPDQLDLPDGVFRYAVDGVTRYEYVVDIGVDPRTGKRRQQRRKGFTSQTRASSARAAVLKELGEGSHVTKDSEALGHYLGEWLEAIRATIEPTTLESYQRNVDNHVIPRIGGLKLQAVTATDLSGVYATLFESGRLDGKGGLSARTTRYIATIMHRALKDAAADRRITHNPADHARVPKTDSKGRPHVVWTGPQLGAFLDQIEGDRLAPVVHLVAMTGMRRGEAMGLRWKDVDLDRGRLTVNQQLRTVRHRMEFAGLKTKKSRRSIALDLGTVQMLRDHHKAQVVYRLDLDLVFPTLDGSPWHPEAMAKAFDRRVARSKLPRIRFHDLRHTWATLALQAGVPAKVVSERLGHSGIAITLDTYTHVIETLDGEAAAAVAAIVTAGRR